jgi:histidinol dehydrogenase
LKIVEGFESANELLSRQILYALNITPQLRQSISDRYEVDDLEGTVAEIIYNVASRGDAAVRECTLKFDITLEEVASLEVDAGQLENACREIDPELLAALKLAAGRIKDFHLKQKGAIWESVAKMDGRQLVRPLQRVGIYAPGGIAFYPSTVLMTAIPARVAGVNEVVMATPRAPGGVVPAPTLAAAAIAGVDRVFGIGGAEAVAALAYGTESVPRVDKICGPGNIFVTVAKKMVYGVVDIDGLKGPSEVIVIADETADAGYCASELLAQAEHDVLAAPIMITNSAVLAAKVEAEVERLAKELPRQAVIKMSLADNGVIIVVASLGEAIALANSYAPEHLCLLVENPGSYIETIKNAGCIVTGPRATVVMGDYIDGPSHALPTGGTARFGSPLSVNDFIKFIDVVNVDETSINELGPSAALIARAERLEAHARAVEMRLEDPQRGNK